MKNDKSNSSFNGANGEVHPNAQTSTDDSLSHQNPAAGEPTVLSRNKGKRPVACSPDVLGGRLAFSVKEVAAILGVCEKSVRRLVARGLLRPSRALRHLRIARSEVEKFLERSTAE